jgi:AraC family transcriptional regulator
MTAPERLRYDACIVVPEGFRVDGGPDEQVLAGGAHAVVVHRGPYERLPEVYGELMGRWLPASGRTARGVPYEIYRNDAQTTPPAELVTEIRVPLA